MCTGRISIGLYHTAGKGTRLAPLPGAENNNKPGVKLPGSVQLSDGRSARITILESVIKQTGCYAKSRLGRLSVFWGDQVSKNGYRLAPLKIEINNILTVCVGPSCRRFLFRMFRWSTYRHFMWIFYVRWVQ